VSIGEGRRRFLLDPSRLLDDELPTLLDGAVRIDVDDQALARVDRAWPSARAPSSGTECVSPPMASCCSLAMTAGGPAD
jgi:hypothetical protein